MEIYTRTLSLFLPASSQLTSADQCCYSVWRKTSEVTFRK